MANVVALRCYRSDWFLVVLALNWALMAQGLGQRGEGFAIYWQRKRNIEEQTIIWDWGVRMIIIYDYLQMF